jgi:predicted RNase H-like HicB family nuclease
MTDRSERDLRDDDRPHGASVVCSDCTFRVHVRGATRGETRREANEWIERHHGGRPDHDTYVTDLEVARPVVEPRLGSRGVVLVERRNDRAFIASTHAVTVER